MIGGTFSVQGMT